MYKIQIRIGMNICVRTVLQYERKKKIEKHKHKHINLTKFNRFTAATSIYIYSATYHGR